MRADNLALRDWEKPWGTFFEGPGNFSGPKGNFEIKTCYIAAQFLAHKPVNSASLTNSFIVLHIFKIMETSILNANTTNAKQLSGPESYRDFRETGPWGRGWSAGAWRMNSGWYNKHSTTSSTHEDLILGETFSAHNIVTVL